MRARTNINSILRIPIITMFFVFISGCTTILVSPYDEKLVSDTEAFYKKAAEVIEEGRIASPLNDQERENIENPSMHGGHFSQFEGKYNSLIIDAEALILRSMASDNKIDSAGQDLQAEISELINTTIPSNCKELSNQFANASLTTKNYVDLKCIILEWKDQHADMQLTDNTKILKKANWEGRKMLVFNVVLAIQKTEGFKRQETEFEEAE